MTIRAHGTVRRGRWALRIHEMVLVEGLAAVIGPNGSGKTTLVRLLAGLEGLDDGELVVDKAVLDQPSSGRFVPSHRRRVAVVFQDHRLFAHLSALDNVAFAMRRRGVAAAPARARAFELLDRVGVSSRAGQLPRTLSGGEAQRVAVARALAADADVLVLDEPLASIDEQSRAAIRRVLADSPCRHTLLVTHDAVAVRALAPTVVALDGGEVVRCGPIERVTADSGSHWAATFLGANVVSGTARGTTVMTDDGFALTVADSASGRVHVTFAAHSVALHPERPEGSARNSWPAVVDQVDLRGTRARVTLSGPLLVRAEVTAAAVEALALRPGSRVWASVKATELVVVAP